VEAKGWYADESPSPQTPRNIAISLSLEAAEVLEHYQWSEETDREALARELADVALYLLQLAYLEGIDLEEAVLDKLRANYRRRWSKE
jgi:NTP pyrophosphatase (non-canonical NTP hydrolase)